MAPKSTACKIDTADAAAAARAKNGSEVQESLCTTPDEKTPSTTPAEARWCS